MTFDYFIDTLSDNQKSIVLFLHDIFLKYPQIESKIRFKIPFYFHTSWICYLNPLKGDKIELCFLDGKMLSNEQGLLDAKGRKRVAGITINDLGSMPLDAIHDIFTEAIYYLQSKK